MFAITKIFIKNYIKFFGQRVDMGHIKYTVLAHGNWEIFHDSMIMTSFILNLVEKIRNEFSGKNNDSLKVSNVKFPIVFPVENSTLKYYPSIVAFKFCIIPRNVIFRLNKLVALV